MGVDDGRAKVEEDVGLRPVTHTPTHPHITDLKIALRHIDETYGIFQSFHIISRNTSAFGWIEIAF